MFIAAQIVGVFAVTSFLLSYQLKRRSAILLVNGCSSVLYVLQYILLGAFEGALIDITAVIITFVARQKEQKFIKKHLVFLIVLLNVLVVLAGCVTYQNLYSLLPIIGTILQTGSFWMTKEKNIRLVSFLSMPPWLVYNFISMAYWPALGNLFCMASIGIAMYRYDRPKKKEEMSVL